MSGDNNAHVSMGQPTIRVRYGRNTDATVLAELGARTFSDTFAKDNTPEDMRAYLAANFSPGKQNDELSDPQAVFLIAEVEMVAVGYAKLEASNAPADVIGRRPIELVRLYAAKDWLGKGVGSALMQG